MGKWHDNMDDQEGCKEAHTNKQKMCRKKDGDHVGCRVWDRAMKMQSDIGLVFLGCDTTLWKQRTVKRKENRKISNYTTTEVK